VRQLVLVLAALFAFGAFAQTTPAVLSPAGPTSLDVITARFTLTPCFTRTISTVVTGSLVTTTVTELDCVIITAPPEEVTATFGPLPVGLYTYEIYVVPEGNPPFLRSRQQFAVSAPPIPALSTFGFAALAAALAIAAFIALRRG
jgi:hypothetical protein